MKRRQLPSLEDTALILARRQTRFAQRPLPHIDQALMPILKSLEKSVPASAKDPTVQELSKHWRDILGDALARHSEPVQMSKSQKTHSGVLKIRVSGAMATLFQHQSPQILEKLNHYVGYHAFEKLTIVQAPLQKPIARAPRLSSQKGASQNMNAFTPLDAKIEADLTKSLSCVREGDLKSALEMLGRNLLRQEILRGSTASKPAGSRLASFKKML